MTLDHAGGSGRLRTWFLVAGAAVAGLVTVLVEAPFAPVLPRLVVGGTGTASRAEAG